MPRGGNARRRDRRGRSGRGSLLPPGLPAALTRQERFEDLVTESAERLRERWGSKVERMSFEVAFVPDELALLRAEAQGEAHPLGASLPGKRKEPPRVIVFRRPLETVAGSQEALPWLVHDVVVELVAELLAMPPERVDPDYRAEPPEHDD